MVYSQQLRMPGVTGATSKALASASDRPLTLATQSKMLSYGSSQVESVMGLPIHLLLDMMLTAATLMLYSRLRRRELGSRLTLLSY